MKVFSEKTPCRLKRLLTTRTVEELDASRVSLLETQTSQMALDLKITDLLSFLQRYQASCPNLRMICPLSGVPLPYININMDQSLEMRATMEFSLRLTEAFMKDILASRAAAVEVSH